MIMGFLLILSFGYEIPIVHIMKTACGSGTAAFGIVSALNNKRDFKERIYQPSKKSIELEVRLSSDALYVESVSIGGIVDVIAKGELFLDD